MAATFRIRVFEENGSWFFRWDNVAVPTVCSVTPPLRTREEADSEKKRFIESEREKTRGATFELDD